VCLPRVEPARIWQLLRTEGITHFSAAPTVLTMIASAEEAEAGPVSPRVAVQTGGAPPTPTLLARMSALDMDVTHLYGLTETYGPVAVNQWHPEWDDLPDEQQAELKARQGVANVVAEPLRVVGEDGADVPRDGETLGEIVARGNDVMLGYYQDEEATAKATLPGPDGDPAGSAPATSLSSTRTATSRSATAARTSSSPAARTSPRSRSSGRWTPTPPCWSPPWSPSPTRSGGRSRSRT
jgi:fatty-acyl-CoA synthase